MRTAIIVDIDGTLALRGDRTPYDWDRVGEDLPNEPIVDLVRALDNHLDPTIIYVSGRSDVCRAETMAWLEKTVCYVGVNEPLFMREHGDNRPDYVVKREIFDKHIRGLYDVKYVIDDRETVVAMWRSLGLTVLQVAEGKF